MSLTNEHTGDYDDTYGLEESDVLPLVEPTGELLEAIIVLAQKRIGD